MSRELSAREAKKAGQIIMAAGAVILILVIYEIVVEFSELDALFSVVLALAVAGCGWVIYLGYRMAFNSAQSCELMSVRMLYAMSVLMLFLGVLLIALGLWFNALVYALVQSVLFFGLAVQLIGLAGRRRSSGA